MPVFFILLWGITSLLLVYTYILYPCLLLIFKSRNTRRIKEYPEREKMPIISCIIAVYNEELIIGKKIQSILELDYPLDRVHIYIGSDGSTDRSNEIISHFSTKHSNIHCFYFGARNGKSTVIDNLSKQALHVHPPSDDHILVYTDANVLFETNTLTEIVASFSDKDVAVVDSRIVQKGIRKDGISESEKDYMSLEIQLKYIEGELWGLSMGAFGGCYGLRSTYAVTIPQEIIVDDFYISMHAMLKGGKCITNLDARCYESIPNLLQEEFKRKLRISSGNFQNLSLFLKYSFKHKWSLLFVFISHKVLRWFGPIFIVLQCISAGMLCFYDYSIFKVISYINLLVLVFLPLLDVVLQKAHVHLRFLRGWRYFLTMNIALFCGLIRYLKGLKQSSWEPPKRLI